jgi:hypothetical protein
MVWGFKMNFTGATASGAADPNPPKTGPASDDFKKAVEKYQGNK